MARKKPEAKSKTAVRAQRISHRRVPGSAGGARAGEKKLLEKAVDLDTEQLPKPPVRDKGSSRPAKERAPR